MDKTTIMVAYGALTVALVVIGYKYTNKFINVTSEIGGLIGGIVGVLISVGLWYTVGKKLIKNA
jgi:hypothetical protein